MIKCLTPANITVQNSEFYINYDNYNNVNTFEFEDSSLCEVQDDGNIQHLYFRDNNLTSHQIYYGNYKHIYALYSDINHREIHVAVIHNTFHLGKLIWFNM